MGEIEPPFIIKNHFHLLLCELSILGSLFFFLIIKGSLHMKGICSMTALYVSKIFSHFVVCLSELLNILSFIIFFSIITSGFCVILPALSQLRETVWVCLVFLPCSLAWKSSSGSKLSNLSIHPRYVCAQL